MMAVCVKICREKKLQWPSASLKKWYAFGKLTDDKKSKTIIFRRYFDANTVSILDTSMFTGHTHTHSGIHVCPRVRPTITYKTVKRKLRAWIPEIFLTCVFKNCWNISIDAHVCLFAFFVGLIRFVYFKLCCVVLHSLNKILLVNYQ